MKILLLGASGQIGQELYKTLTAVGQVFPLTRRHCDFTDFAAVERMLDTEMPAVVVNAAAYTAVDKAEAEAEQADMVNHRLPALLAQWCVRNNGLLVDFSTDYIFDGRKHSPWLETDPRNPLNTYGRTKAAGLAAIETSGCRYLVFIVTWVYAREGTNFPNTMVGLAMERAELNVVSDQIGVPTPAEWIARQVAHCIPQVLAEPRKAGLYNLAPSGNTSWCDFAREVIDLAGKRGVALKMGPDDVHPIPSAKYPTPAKRPANSLLNTGKLRVTFGIEPAHWRTLYRQN